MRELYLITCASHTAWLCQFSSVQVLSQILPSCLVCSHWSGFLQTDLSLILPSCLVCYTPVPIDLGSILQTDLTTKWISCSILSPTLQTSTSPHAILQIHQHCNSWDPSTLPSQSWSHQSPAPSSTSSTMSQANLKILQGFVWHNHIFSKVSKLSLCHS